MRVVALTVFVDLVAVGIQQIGIGMIGEVQRRFGQGVNSQFVILVHEQQEVAGGQGGGAVGGGADMAVGLAVSDGDARIVDQCLQIRPRPGIGAGVIGDAQLPVRVNLTLDGLDGAGEKAQRRVVDRHDDRNFRQRRTASRQPVLQGQGCPRVPLIHAQPGGVRIDGGG